ncbi:serine hydrolase domain-containing protein [Actinophytocola algeriensis]|uniref:CubicO group peptidase (Beta-lactamase class C family) n=1 Tax=Actinophytocola algeriensis TaxID=1768010 RepID=A0A7W7Q6H3_9PSEU|nr:serine hydrolase domain-containing protein [Actinophytocola algeriensis]MBB4907728.1 CubicO group peptidase (beta-lactamase class C family) [Actinophytocola algeriensis]MBE1479758.1 CubicO group peptidase (beta-lactamase class C family) [Actinophytocola algeriensis]
MTELRELLARYVGDGSLPGAVAVVARGAEVEVAVAGSVALDGTAPMTRESIFRIASVTKPITAAGLLVLVDDGVVGLDDPISRWLPELAEPVVVRTPASPVDDVVPVNRPITVFDVLTGQAGWGFASDFGSPAVRALFPVQQDGREVRRFPPADEWVAALATVPLLYQPGESWLYDTCSAIQGVLVARAAGTSLPDFLTERVFTPLGMTDSGFSVPAAKRDRFTGFYKKTPAGLTLADAQDGQWATEPAFPLGSGGLVGTVDDWLAFGRMLLAGGAPVLSRAAVRLMTTDHTTPAHREIGALFLEGDGWGMGGSVNGTRYGWVGGTGTSAHVDFATGTAAILFTQVGEDSPVAPEWMREFWHLTRDLAN